MTMLYPQSNPFRQHIDLSGFWDLRFDPAGTGTAAGLPNGFSDGRPAAVPASWNDQFEDMRDYLSHTWYQTTFDLPWGWDAALQHIWVRFGSVNYLTEVWLNGIQLGRHEGGHLPFEFDLTPHVRGEGNRLVVSVEGELAPDRVPPGTIPPNPSDSFASTSFPDASFDFFPFCGIHRPVLLYAVPRESITDLTVVSEVAGRKARVHVNLKRIGNDKVTARFALRGTDTSAETTFASEEVEVLLEVA